MDARKRLKVRDGLAISIYPMQSGRHIVSAWDLEVAMLWRAAFS